jgi:hypothetical protein
MSKLTKPITDAYGTQESHTFRTVQRDTRWGLVNISEINASFLHEMALKQVALSSDDDAHWFDFEAEPSTAKPEIDEVCFGLSSDLEQAINRGWHHKLASIIAGAVEKYAEEFCCSFDTEWHVSMGIPQQQPGSNTNLNPAQMSVKIDNGLYHAGYFGVLDRWRCVWVSEDPEHWKLTHSSHWGGGETSTQSHYLIGEDGALVDVTDHPSIPRNEDVTRLLDNVR